MVAQGACQVVVRWWKGGGWAVAAMMVVVASAVFAVVLDARGDYAVGSVSGRVGGL